MFLILCYKVDILNLFPLSPTILARVWHNYCYIIYIIIRRSKQLFSNHSYLLTNSEAFNLFLTLSISRFPFHLLSWKFRNIRATELFLESEIRFLTLEIFPMLSIDLDQRRYHLPWNFNENLWNMNKASVINFNILYYTMA